MHLAALVGYELHTHLQSLMTHLHPARRSEATNAVLAALYPWQRRRFCEPGTRVVGCLACQLGKLYGDEEALEALSVVARSGRRGAAGIVQLVDEGWVPGSRGKGSGDDVRAVRADRRKARGGDDDENLNAEWRGGRVGSARGEVRWREKKGFVLSHGMERGRSKGRGERRGPSRGRSVRIEKPVDVAPPVRPHRPQGLTLSILGKQEDRIRWTRRSNEEDRTIKRKAVPVPNDEDKEEDRVKWARISNEEDRTIKRKRLPVPNDEDIEEGRIRWGRRSNEEERTIKRKPIPVRNDKGKERADKTMSTATTIFGSPKNRNSFRRQSRRPAPSAAASPSSSRATDNEPATHHRSKAASDIHPGPSSVSAYSRTQGIRSTRLKHDLGSPSTRKPPMPTISDSRERKARPRIRSTQQTRWSDFNGSNITAPSPTHPDTPPLDPPSAPRCPKRMHAIGRKIAEGKYQWWVTDYSDSEDEKVVVPSRGRRSLVKAIESANKNKGSNSDNKSDDNDKAANSVTSNSDYEGDEDEEEIRQRYLDEHEALLRMAQGMDSEGVPRTVDYLNTLPERSTELTTEPMLRMARSVREESTVCREPGFRGRSSPWL